LTWLFAKRSKIDVVLNIDSEVDGVWCGVVRSDVGGWKKSGSNTMIISDVEAARPSLFRFVVAFDCLRDWPGGYGDVSADVLHDDERPTQG
jgi:hypothetical protein